MMCRYAICVCDKVLTGNRHSEMSDISRDKSSIRQPIRYQIRIKGPLSDQWSEWFENMTIRPDEDGNTLISRPVVDDAALHGLLKKVRDLRLSLLSVYRVEPGEDEVDCHKA